MLAFAAAALPFSGAGTMLALPFAAIPQRLCGGNFSLPLILVRGLHDTVVLGGAAVRRSWRWRLKLGATLQ